ncbi:MAG: KamA family radical SAM protein [Deltaproteobacteria bacterium]|nr:KamA family radical SAM protein [Deltaproteobacteria bacterium]
MLQARPELRSVWGEIQRVFPLRIPKSWWERIDLEDRGDPLGLQVVPHPGEAGEDLEGLDDPVGEELSAPVPLVVQKHRDRVVLLVTRACFLHCRYCFRRGMDLSPVSPDALGRAVAWIRQAGVREVILSGGDPLVLPDARLLDLIDALRPQVPVVRIHTRGPVASPERITEALARGLAARAPVWVVVSVNHPAELTPEADRALATLVDAGVPVLNQAVLLRGVNADVEVLEALSSALVARRVMPYYLHHTDHARGNAHLRVTLEEGLALHAELERRVSGLALPRYVIDPPDGSGKVPVERWARSR